MNGSASQNARRLAVLLGLGFALSLLAGGAARAQPNSKERQALTAAYSGWRRAATCATSAAPRPVPGARQQIARGERVLKRASQHGLGRLLREIDAEYRRIDATSDWSCGDGDQLAPPG